MIDQEACCQKQKIKPGKAATNPNSRRVPGGSVKKSDAIRKFGQETGSITLREFMSRETSEFKVIRTATGREMTRDMFACVIGKQEKVKRE
jgi:hypothetical protein